ncbi:hypothetical protein [Halosimplex pelagicum]|uniref:Uncharacterized protein n=1 Tax=Halosimplex pelagicum TaxID=869886 RepID=A0A7D5T3Y0_9EURY|nr:hypothetical protein [Halosimplex pelagicum]QLH82231.1 hypothetical protein HZS54_11700 [Halosimplex pelagicum]
MSQHGFNIGDEVLIRADQVGTIKMLGAETALVECRAGNELTVSYEELNSDFSLPLEGRETVTVELTRYAKYADTVRKERPEIVLRQDEIKPNKQARRVMNWGEHTYVDYYLKKPDRMFGIKSVRSGAVTRNSFKIHGKTVSFSGVREDLGIEIGYGESVPLDAMWDNDQNILVCDYSDLI